MTPGTDCTASSSLSSMGTLLPCTVAHSVTLPLATCFTATRAPSATRAAAYTVPNPPRPSTSPTRYSCSKAGRAALLQAPAPWSPPPGPRPRPA